MLSPKDLSSLSEVDGIEVKASTDLKLTLKGVEFTAYHLDDDPAFYLGSSSSDRASFRIDSPDVLIRLASKLIELRELGVFDGK